MPGSGGACQPTLYRLCINFDEVDPRLGTKRLELLRDCMSAKVGHLHPVGIVRTL